MVKKRFGDARRSQETHINEMMAVHAREVQELILERTRLESEGGTTEDDEEIEN